MMMESTDFPYLYLRLAHERFAAKCHHHVIYKNGDRLFSKVHTAREVLPIQHRFWQVKTLHRVSIGYHSQVSPFWNAESYLRIVPFVHLLAYIAYLPFY